MSHKAPLISRLKARRQAVGWSLKEVGERCAIEERFLHDWEGGIGSPRLDALDHWAAALGMRLSLVDAENEPRRGLQVDWGNRRIWVDGSPVRLTPMEWKALERLAAAPGELIGHRELFRHLYGDARLYTPQSTAIRVLITKLRRLLPPLRIEAQWGRGYVVSGIEASSLRGGESDGADGGVPPEHAAALAVLPPPPSVRTGVHIATPVAAASAPAAPSLRPDPSGLVRQFLDREASAAEPRPISPPPARIAVHRAEELQVIERFLAERGATRCPDVATIERAPLPTLVWDKTKRKWVRPGMTDCVAS